MAAVRVLQEGLGLAEERRPQGEGRAPRGTLDVDGEVEGAVPDPFQVLEPDADVRVPAELEEAADALHDGVADVLRRLARRAQDVDEVRPGPEKVG